MFGMATLTVQSTPVPEESKWKSRAIVAAKMLVVAVTIAALVTATVFSCGAFLGLIASGAAAWKIFFMGVALGVTGITAGGAILGARERSLYQDTGHNTEDVASYLENTAASCIRAVNPVIDFAKDIFFYNLLFKN
jgi:predicted phage tail protein